MAEQEPKVEISLAALQELMRTLIQENNKMNPLDQKKYDAELERDKRKALMAVELGRVEEQARLAKQNACPHTRDSRTGLFAPKGTGEWLTGGQLHGNGTATMMCLRCSAEWHWTPTPQERDYIENAGMLGMAPPPAERLIAA